MGSQLTVLMSKFFRDRRHSCTESDKIVIDWKPPSDFGRLKSLKIRLPIRIVHTIAMTNSESSNIHPKSKQKVQTSAQ